MADQKTSAKAVLLAVHSAIHEDITTLRQLKAQYPKALRTEIILRILLTHLPETLETSGYLPLLFDIVATEAHGPQESTIDWTPIGDISDVEAKENVRKLRLLPLQDPSLPQEVAGDLFVAFLLQRSYRVDAQTGLITELAALLAPFLARSQYLRTWFISILLPLLRFSYEYHPQTIATHTLTEFEHLDDRHGIRLLLSETRADPDEDQAVGRDIRGLIGPWMYGDIRSKRRKISNSSQLGGQTVTPIDQEAILEDHIIDGWEEVFGWIMSQGLQSWSTAVAAIEQWDGPGDVDLGGYGESHLALEDEKQRILERRYAQVALATGYLIPEASTNALEGIHCILSRIVSLLDYDRLSTLSNAASILAPVELGDAELLSTSNAKYIRQGIYAKDNILTQPTPGSTSLMEALLLGAFLLTRAGSSCTLKRAGELVLMQDEHQQLLEVQKLFQHVAKNAPKNDDKYWIRVRNELLWLRDWGAEELDAISEQKSGRGIFGRIKKTYLELEMLKLLIANSNYDLARSIYETSPDRPLAPEMVQETVMSAAMNAYDNATNPNRTRGGIKRCDDIIHAFPETFKDSDAAAKIEHLLKATHSLGHYRLVLKQGEPFAPVILRVHKDPISLIGKILDQNPRSFTRVKELVDMGYSMVQAGIAKDAEKLPSSSSSSQVLDLKNNVRLRVTSMCIDAALAEDDFETAYSYVMSNLESNAKLAVASQQPTQPDQLPELLTAQPPPQIIDDWSWRAALQTGKYRRNERTTRPTHLGNASSNVEIRHLEQRMECLSLALRLAPASTLQEILNVYRRCEEKLETRIKKETEQEEAWDIEGDEQAPPGSFAAAMQPEKQPKREVAHATEEAPMSLFDLTRASAAQAQKSFSVFSALQSRASEKLTSQPVSEDLSSSTSSLGGGGGRTGPRKRDQLRDAATGTLASGIGWLIGAPPIVRDQTTGASE